MTRVSRRISILVSVFLVVLILLPLTATAGAASQRGDTSVPPYVRFSGALRDADGQPRTGTVGITFALYEAQQGGVPLWLETQNVALDARGGYTALLGSHTRDGLPTELFSSTEARWLGVQVEGEAEQARVMLVSVPYALKAAEAEKLAGRSASDFVLHEKLSEQVRQEVEAAATDSNKSMTTTGGGTLAVTAAGTVGRIAKFTGVDALGDSTITESGTNLGIGTTAPPNKLAINATSAILPSTMQISHPGGDWGLVFKRNINDGGHPNFTFLKTRGETAVAAQSGDGMGRIVWQAVNAAGSPVPVYAGELSMFVTTVSGANVASDMRFYTKPLAGGVAERLRISPDGFVGVGTASPPNRFAINATAAVLPSTMQLSHPGGDWGLVFKRNTNDGGFPNFTFLKTRGEGAVPALTGDGIGRIVWQAVNGSGVPIYAGDLSMVATAVTATDVGSDMRFSTRSTTIGLAERMRITPEGRVGIGNTSPGSALHVNGTVTATAFLGDGSGLINLPGDITAVNTSAGSGLTGGVTSGAAGLSLLTSCASGELLKWSAEGAWACAADNTSTGAGGDPVAFSGSNTSSIVSATQTGPGIPNASLENFPPVAIFGRSTHATGFTAGVAGWSDGLSGAGLIGVATGGPTEDDDAFGVLAIASATSGRTIGISGEVLSPDGVALDLHHEHTSGTLITANAGPEGSSETVFQIKRGSSFLEGNFGVLQGNLGVEGNLSAGPGTHSLTGNTVVGGNLNVSGTLSKGSGTFKIDHPLDPLNKHLYHSFVESPDMMNVYNGNAVLDASGEAWVELPAYFEALNRDFRYQLTPIGNPAGHVAYVAEEVASNRFKIAGGRPDGKVSWQVTGIRDDAFARANPVVVEVKKPAAEAGTYLHPEAFRQQQAAAAPAPARRKTD